MATWFPNQQLAPRPNLAVNGDQYGVCGEYGASVCAPSFAVLRAGEYVYIQVRIGLDCMAGATVLSGFCFRVHFCLS
jgi:hypothetical protein